MIKLVHDSGDSGDSKPGFGALALMRSLERQLVAQRHLPSAEAQELFWDALDAPTVAKEFAILQQVLALDPGHTDALLAVLRHRPLGQEDEIEVLCKVVALAEQRLGPQGFKEYAGRFWGYHETRPYMRARAQLAATLQHAGRIEEAIVELEAMLQLNPNDNQGLRYGLLASYLFSRRLDGAARLFEEHDECDWNTVFAWGRVLERWLVDDTAGAQEALAVARRQNGYAEAYIKGHRRPPKHVPDMYSPGNKEEAQCFAESLRMMWKAHPKALAWLATQANGRHGIGKK